MKLQPWVYNDRTRRGDRKWTAMVRVYTPGVARGKMVRVGWYSSEEDAITARDAAVARLVEHPDGATVRDGRLQKHCQECGGLYSPYGRQVRCTTCRDARLPRRRCAQCTRLFQPRSRDHKLCGPECRRLHRILKEAGER